MSLSKVLSTLILGLSLVWANPINADTLSSDDVKLEVSKSELQCLTQNIYYEAGSESYKGKMAVAAVTINRTNAPNFPSTVCGVVEQKTSVNGQKICQFSWRCMNLSMLKKINKKLWDESAEVAWAALVEAKIPEEYVKKNILYFHSVFISPNWHLKRIARIDNNIFYTNWSV